METGENYLFFGGGNILKHQILTCNFIDKICMRCPNCVIFRPICKYWGVYCSMLDIFLIIQWRVRVSPEMIELHFSTYSHILWFNEILPEKNFNYVFAHHSSINAHTHFFLKTSIFSILTKTSLPEFLPTILPAMVIRDRWL